MLLVGIRNPRNADVRGVDYRNTNHARISHITTYELSVYGKGVSSGEQSAALGFIS